MESTAREDKQYASWTANDQIKAAKGDESKIAKIRADLETKRKEIDARRDAQIAELKQM